MPRPLVTIAISTYNRASGYLREALDSALAQRYEPLDIVVVDNASTDGTCELVRSLTDERVRYVRHEKNIGANGNFNACLEHARGEYFLLLHDDDRIDTDFVLHAMTALEGWEGAELPGLIRTGCRVMDAAGATLSEYRNEAGGGSVANLARTWFAVASPMYFCNTLFRTDALRLAGGFRSRRELLIDVAAVFRIAAQHPVLDLADAKASFRRHGGNNGSAQSIKAWCEDSSYLLDLICASAPADADELRAVGLRYFIGSNYTRAARISDLGQRLRAYWTVYRHFGYRVSPLRIAAYRAFRRRRAVEGSSP
jgi:glycosyltransferase involved in cell wall biosynthesis